MKGRREGVGVKDAKDVTMQRARSELIPMRLMSKFPMKRRTSMRIVAKSQRAEDAQGGEQMVVDVVYSNEKAMLVRRRQSPIPSSTPKF